MKSQKNKWFQVALIAACAFSSAAALASTGHEGSGGGGAIQTTDGLKTLPEAGVILHEALSNIPFKKYPEYYLISAAVKAEVKNIFDSLPWDKKTRDFFTASVIANETAFIKASALNEEQQQEIYNEYRLVVQAFGKKLDPATFVLAAVTRDDGKTYILPTFDQFKSPREQALILIHEKFMRDWLLRQALTPDRLAKILEFDSELYLVLQAQDQGLPCDYMRLMAALGNLTSDIKLPNVIGAIELLQMQAKSHTPLYIDQFVPGYVPQGQHLKNDRFCHYVDAGLVNTWFSSLDNRAAYIFDGSAILGHDFYSIDRVFEAEKFPSIPKKGGGGYFPFFDTCDDNAFDYLCIGRKLLNAMQDYTKQVCKQYNEKSGREFLYVDRQTMQPLVMNCELTRYIEIEISGSAKFGWDQ